MPPYTIKYYEENLNFFQSSSPLIKNVDEITQDVIDSYSSMLMGKEDRITAINARLRGLFVFLRFSFKKGWAESYPLSQLKEDEYPNAFFVYKNGGVMAPFDVDNDMGPRERRENYTAKIREIMVYYTGKQRIQGCRIKTATETRWSCLE